MDWLWKVMWLLSGELVSQCVELGNDSSTLPTAVANHSKQRSIEDRQDITSYQSSYYPYPPPSYGPPPTEISGGMVHIEFAFDVIVIRCIAEEPYEHIVWIRYQCPQQFRFGGEGVHIADGSNVYDDDLYDVHIRGHDGTIISELRLKKPLADNSQGVYQCESWPHFHMGGGGGHFPYISYQTYHPSKSEVFIIGGDSLLGYCYNVNNFGPQPSKLSGIENKQGTNNIKVKLNLSTLKPRCNTTDVRKENIPKHYNLKYEDNILYNLEGANVTADFFHPSKRIPFHFSGFPHNISKITPNNMTSSFFDYTGRSNDKFIDMYPKLNISKGQISNIFFNSSSNH